VSKDESTHDSDKEIHPNPDSSSSSQLRLRQGRDKIIERQASA